MRIQIDPDCLVAPLQYVADHYAPEITQAGMDFSKATYQHSRLSLREFEGARARVAQINGCRACKAWRSEHDVPLYLATLGGSGESVVDHGGTPPDETFYAAVDEWRTSPIFDDRERLAIEFAERMSLDPQSLASDDAFWKRFKQCFSDRDTVDLTFCVACWIGLGRTLHVLGLDTVCQMPSAPVAAGLADTSARI